MRLRPLTARNPILGVVVSALGLSAGLLGACNGAGSDDCATGAEGCACFEDQCLGELVCNFNNICIHPDAGTISGGIGDDDGGSDTDPGTAGITQGASAGPDEGPPEVLEVTIDADGLAPASEPARVTATVTDPDGAGDVTEATVESASGDLLLRLEKVSTNTFAGDLEWGEFYNNGLDLGIEVEVMLTVRDSAFNETSQPLSLIVCESGDSFCNGGCLRTIDDDDNCGACGNVCGPSEECFSGWCYNDGYYADVDVEGTLDEGSEPEPEASALPIATPAGGVSLSHTEPRRPLERVDVAAFALGSAPPRR